MIVDFRLFLINLRGQNMNVALTTLQAIGRTVKYTTGIDSATSKTPI